MRATAALATTPACPSFPSCLLFQAQHRDLGTGLHHQAKNSTRPQRAPKKSPNLRPESLGKPWRLGRGQCTLPALSLLSVVGREPALGSAGDTRPRDRSGGSAKGRGRKRQKYREDLPEGAQRCLPPPPHPRQDASITSYYELPDLQKLKELHDRSFPVTKFKKNLNQS